MQSRCREPRLTLGDLIDEWLPKLAVNAGAALDAKTQAVFRSVWLEGLGDLAPEVLRAAFQKTLREFVFWPVKVADIRKHVSHAESNATNESAEQAWQRALEIRRAHYNPDMPQHLARVLARLPERIRQAARAAGIFREHDSIEALHVWAKKRFVESFIAYGELEHDKFLLPEGDVKHLIADIAEAKALPASSEDLERDWNAMRARGLAYAEKIKGDPSQQPDLKRAIRELTFRPSLHSLDEQKRILREKGLLK